MALFVTPNFWCWTQTICDWCHIKTLKWTIVAFLKAYVLTPRGRFSPLKAQQGLGVE